MKPQPFRILKNATLPFIRSLTLFTTSFVAGDSRALNIAVVNYGGLIVDYLILQDTGFMCLEPSINTISTGALAFYREVLLSKARISVF